MKCCAIPDTAKTALKTMARRLIKRAGGLESAAMACRASKTSLGRFVNPADDQHIPADVIADLEADVGEPIVTRELARLAGYDLVPVGTEGPGRHIDPSTMANSVLCALAEFVEAVEAMDADGRRDLHEIESCRSRMLDVIAAGQRAADSLQTVANHIKGRAA